MAIKMVAAGDALKRLSGVVPASSDFSCCFWYRFTGAVNGKCVWITADSVTGAYADYVDIFAFNSPPSQAGCDVGFGGVNTHLLPNFDMPTPGRWVPMGYVRVADEHFFYFDAALLGTIEESICAATLAEVWLGDDSFSNNPLGQFCNYREWTVGLTLDELKDEWRSQAAVRTADLWTDTPLLDDLLDDSGNGHHWTAVGTPIFVGTPACLNLIAPLADEIASLPFSAVVDPNDTDDVESLPLWWSYAVPALQKAIGAWAYDLATSYNPVITVYEDDGETLIFAPLGAGDKPMQFAVPSGDTIRMVVASGTPVPGSTLTIDVLDAPAGPYSAGDIFINDDAPADANSPRGFPAAIVSPTANYTVIDIIPDIAAGEQGDILANGIVALEELPHGVVTDYFVKLYDAADGFSLITQINAGNGAFLRTCQGTGRFWFATDPGVPACFVQYLEADGTLGPVHTLTGTNVLAAIAANNDETVLYYARNGTSQPIRRWDLVNDVALSDFVPLLTGHNPEDILVLPDGSVVIIWGATTGGTAIVKIYDAAGLLLHTFPFTTYDTSNNSPPRLAYGRDLNDEIWVYLHERWGPGPGDIGIALFIKVTISTGAYTEIRQVEYNRGVYAPDVTDPDVLARFGNSNSCPFFLMTVGEPPPVGAGTLIVRKEVLGGGIQPFDFTVSGLSPSSFSLVDGGEQQFDDVPVGSYSVAEILPDGWLLISATVSNDSPLEAVTVADGETVIVTFVNAIEPPIPPAVSTSPTRLLMRRLRRTPHLSQEQLKTVYRRLQLDMQAGVGLNAGQGENPRLMLRWSDDGGRTWGNLHTVEVGRMGKYGTRALWRNLGAGRDRVFELTMSDPVAWRFVNAILRAETGRS